jgi:hypothetical protein
MLREWINGMASCLNFGWLPDEPLVKKRDDAERMAASWQCVGNYMTTALKHYRRESKDKAHDSESRK